MTGCGGSSNVVLDDSGGDGGGGGTGQSDTTCDDTENTLTTGDYSVTISGNLCRTPAPSAPAEGTLIMSCTTTEPDGELIRDTTEPATDYTTTTCGTGDGADSAIYYCQEGLILKEETGEDTLFPESISFTCTIDAETEEATLDETDLVG